MSQAAPAPSPVKSIEAQILAGIKAYYDANEAALLAAAGPVNEQAATAVEAFLTQVIGRNPFLKLVVGGSIATLVPFLVQYLGGAEAALAAFVDKELAAEIAALSA